MNFLFFSLKLIGLSFICLHKKFISQGENERWTWRKTNKQTVKLASLLRWIGKVCKAGQSRAGAVILYGRVACNKQKEMALNTNRT